MGVPNAIILFLLALCLVGCDAPPQANWRVEEPVELSGFDLVASFDAEVDAAEKLRNGEYFHCASAASILASDLRMQELLRGWVDEVYINYGEGYPDLVNAWEDAKENAEENLRLFEEHGNERLAEITRMHLRALHRIVQRHNLYWGD